MRYNILAMFNLITRRSYVIEGTELLLPRDFPRVAGFDQIFLNAKELDIKSLRSQLLLFQQTPSGNLRLMVINNAQNLSPLLQNTLLKIVEEPPTKGVIILQVGSKESLLPTLRSRLEKVFVRRITRITGEKELRISELFSLERNHIVSELEEIMRSLNLVDKKNVDRHNAIDRTIRKLRSNVNSKLALDWLGLNWRGESGKE